MKYNYARRMADMKASEIRELLKLTEKPEVISFAGGLPAPELFPIEEIKQANDHVLDHHGCQALQYSTTEGYRPLRKWIAQRMNTQLGTSFDVDDIILNLLGVMSGFILWKTWQKGVWHFKRKRKQ